LGRARERSWSIGHITHGAKQTGERRTGNPSAPFDVAGAGDGLIRAPRQSSTLRVSRERQVRLAGASPAGARARRPVAWIAGWRETETLKPIDKAIERMVSESPGRNASERELAPKDPKPRRPSGRLPREGNTGRRSLADAAARSGGAWSDSTVTQTHRATGETLLVPLRNQRSQVGRITGGPGKSSDGERVADGSAVAMKRGNARGAKGPCCSALPPTTRKAGAA